VACGVQVFSNYFEHVFSDLEPVWQPDCASFDGVSVVKDFSFDQALSEPFAEMFAPFFSRDGFLAGLLYSRHSNLSIVVGL
jgi:hypothetical protein